MAAAARLVQLVDPHVVDHCAGRRVSGRVRPNEVAEADRAQAHRGAAERARAEQKLLHLSLDRVRAAVAAEPERVELRISALVILSPVGTHPVCNRRTVQDPGRRLGDRGRSRGTRGTGRSRRSLRAGGPRLPARTLGTARSPSGKGQRDLAPRTSFTGLYDVERATPLRDASAHRSPGTHQRRARRVGAATENHEQAYRRDDIGVRHMPTDSTTQNDESSSVCTPLTALTHPPDAVSVAARRDRDNRAFARACNCCRGRLMILAFSPRVCLRGPLRSIVRPRGSSRASRAAVARSGTAQMRDCRQSAPRRRWRAPAHEALTPEPAPAGTAPSRNRDRGCPWPAQAAEQARA